MLHTERGLETSRYAGGTYPRTGESDPAVANNENNIYILAACYRMRNGGKQENEKFFLTLYVPFGILMAIDAGIGVCVIGDDVLLVGVIPLFLGRGWR